MTATVQLSKPTASPLLPARVGSGAATTASGRAVLGLSLPDQLASSGLWRHHKSLAGRYLRAHCAGCHVNGGTSCAAAKTLKCGAGAQRRAGRGHCRDFAAGGIGQMPAAMEPFLARVERSCSAIGCGTGPEQTGPPKSPKALKRLGSRGRTFSFRPESPPANYTSAGGERLPPATDCRLVDPQTHGCCLPVSSEGDQQAAVSLLR